MKRFHKSKGPTCNKAKRRKVLLTGHTAGHGQIGFLAVLLLVSVFVCVYSFHLPPTAVQARPNSPAKVAAAFGPTVPNLQPPPEKVPQGMAWISGGEFSMGAQDPPEMDMVGMQATKDSRPIHRVYVDGFFMDKTDVTNAQFREFVQATGYVTVAERTPRAEDFPGAPPENLVAGA